MVLLSVTGFVRMVLIILGVIVILRFLGQLMNARRSMESERQMHAKQRKNQQDVESARQNFGKTTVHRIDKNQANSGDYADYEEIKE